MSVINNLMHAVSDHGNAIASKVITYFGLASIGGGGILGATNGTVEKIHQAQTFGLPDWAAVVSIVGGLCLIIKNSIDAYYTVQDRRERKEQERQQRLVDIANAYMGEDKRKEDRRK